VLHRFYPIAELIYCPIAFLLLVSTTGIDLLGIGFNLGLSLTGGYKWIFLFALFALLGGNPVDAVFAILSTSFNCNVLLFL